MKKFIFLAILIVSSLALADYTFTTRKTYCTNPDYDSATMYYDRDGYPYIAVGFQNCYYNGNKVSGGPFVFYGYEVDQSFFNRIIKSQHPYLFFRDDVTVTVKEASDGLHWKVLNRSVSGRPPYVFKSEYQYE